MKKKALGKGLSALISDIPEDMITAKEQGLLKEINTHLLSPNKNQPRKNFDPQALEELAVSIKNNGILQPLVVTPLHDGKYQIVVGERRYRASLLINLPKLPCIIKDLSDDKILEWGLLENLQRENLNSLEIARTYQELINRLNMSQEQFATYIGKSRSSVSNTLRLLKLPKVIQDDLLSNKITEGHARAIVAFENIDEMLFLRDSILKKNLSVRDAEKYVQNEKKSKSSAPKSLKKQMANSFEVKTIEENLSLLFKSKVNLVPKNETQGKIEFHYNNLKEFEQVKEMLLSVAESHKFWI